MEKVQIVEERSSALKNWNLALSQVKDREVAIVDLNFKIGHLQAALLKLGGKDAVVGIMKEMELGNFHHHQGKPVMYKGFFTFCNVFHL